MGRRFSAVGCVLGQLEPDLSFPYIDAVLALPDIAERDKIVDILTMTPKSKPRARAVNGGTKARKLKPSSPSTV